MKNFRVQSASEHLLNKELYIKKPKKLQLKQLVSSINFILYLHLAVSVWKKLLNRPKILVQNYLNLTYVSMNIYVMTLLREFANMNATKV